MKRKILIISALVLMMVLSTASASAVFAGTDSSKASSQIAKKQSTVTLTSGRPVSVSNYDTSTKYFKFTAKYTGYANLTGTRLVGNVTLLNSKQKAISSRDYFSDTSSASYYRYIRYGVKKGQTYYFKIYGYGNYGDGGYVLKYTNVKVSEKSGSKRSKARKISKNKSYKGSITAGSSRADWYKLKLSKNAKFKVTVRGTTNEKMVVTLYRSGGKKLVSQSFYRWSKGARIWSYGKASKGTYYVKIARGKKGSSGNYSIKWK